VDVAAYGRAKISWPLIRLQMTCGSPSRTSGPYSKVARPSGAQGQFEDASRPAYALDA
jgi:hypothetical protein